MIELETKQVDEAEPIRRILNTVSLVCLIGAISLFWITGGWKFGAGSILLALAIELDTAVALDKLHERMLNFIDRYFS